MFKQRFWKLHKLCKLAWKMYLATNSGSCFPGSDSRDAATAV